MSKNISSFKNFSTNLILKFILFYFKAMKFQHTTKRRPINIQKNYLLENLLIS